MVDNKKHCEQIANTLDRIARGDMYTCPNCGEWICEYDGATYDETHDTITCKHCGADFNSVEAEQVSLFDYFEDVYNIEYHVDSNKEYRSVEVMIACGGPNIYINTKSGRVELYWWGSNAYYPMHPTTSDAIDDVFSEIWECM